jgi:transcription initiation factor TFIID TATA-box-binding protein
MLNPVTWEVSNIVGVATLAESLNLEKLRLAIPSADYDPEIFPGMTIRLEKPRIHALLFKSGKARLTGAKREEDIHSASRALWRQLRELREPVLERPSSVIVNVVITFKLPTKIDLERLARSLVESRSEYEPEQFPGLVLRDFHGDCVGLIFGSGKGVLAGLKSVGETEHALVSLRAKYALSDFSK